MSAASTMVSTCAACGAEESLDSLLHRMIDDDQVRRLLADIMTTSLPLGQLVVRYLRLHKPAKQKLRMDKVAKVLGELVPDMVNATIERKGRTWYIDKEGWKLALEAVFAAQTKGTLTLPLDGNAYLYEVLMRLADKAEGEAEKTAAASSKSRPYIHGAQSIGDIAAGVLTMQTAKGPVSVQVTDFKAPVIAAPREHGTSPLVKAMKAQLREKNADATTAPVLPTSN
ncbi:MAG: hypothetical protein Q7K57_12790 [Burkholderiaceae bacterium]|nr:hypothetical protein [Burkholderiaceae bacterium]